MEFGGERRAAASWLAWRGLRSSERLAQADGQTVRRYVRRPGRPGSACTARRRATGSKGSTPRSSQGCGPAPTEGGGRAPRANRPGAVVDVRGASTSSHRPAASAMPRLELVLVDEVTRRDTTSADRRARTPARTRRGHRRLSVDPHAGRAIPATDQELQPSRRTSDCRGHGATRTAVETVGADGRADGGGGLQRRPTPDGPSTTSVTTSAGPVPASAQPAPATDASPTAGAAPATSPAEGPPSSAAAMTQPATFEQREPYPSCGEDFSLELDRMGPLSSTRQCLLDANAVGKEAELTAHEASTPFGPAAYLVYRTNADRSVDVFIAGRPWRLAHCDRLVTDERAVFTVHGCDDPVEIG